MDLLQRYSIIVRRIDALINGLMLSSNRLREMMWVEYHRELASVNRSQLTLQPLWSLFLKVDLRKAAIR